MTDSEITNVLVNALGTAADKEAGAKTALVSVTIEILARGERGAAEARLVRKTRTLVFMSTEFVSVTGVRVASASSVHKLVEG